MNQQHAMTSGVTRVLWEDSSGQPLEQRVRRAVAECKRRRGITAAAVYVPADELAEEITVDDIPVIPLKQVGKFTMQIEPTRATAITAIEEAGRG